MRIEGKERLISKFKALPPAVQSAVAKGVRDGSDETIGFMKRVAPHGATGALIDSIRYEIDDQQTAFRSTIMAGGTAATKRELRQGSGKFGDEAVFMEFGTKPHKAGGK